MKLYAWGHACVSLEDERACIVLDPGVWSDIVDVLARATAVMVTHDHADHLHVEQLRAVLQERPELHVWGPSSVRDALVGAGVATEQVHELAAGDRIDLDGVEVTAVGGTHAVVHPDLPPAANLGYLVAGIYHPGDCVLPPGVPIELLLTPVAGPWLLLADAVDLVRAAAPQVVVPIHDAILSSAGQELVDRVLGGLGGVPVTRLASGESLDLRDTAR